MMAIDIQALVIKRLYLFFIKIHQIVKIIVERLLYSA